VGLGQKPENQVTHRHSERRYPALDKTHQARELTVTFTLRQSGTLIRVISTRDQHRRQRHLHEHAKQ
jgi:uncharacterized DUF497 family protein